MQSTSWGKDNTASGTSSLAFGLNNTSSGINSSSWGYNNSVSSSGATSWGSNNIISGNYGTTWGNTNTVESSLGTAWGSFNEITNEALGATVCGLDNLSDGYYSFVSGITNEVYSYGEVAFGRWNYSPTDGDFSNWIQGDMLFSIGNGNNPSARKNALSILKNGNVGIGVDDPSYDLHLSNDDAAKPGSSAWTVSSDRRLKKDISTFTDGLAVVSAIEPVWFTYNGLADIPEGTFVGTIAQDLEEIAPYMVTEYTHRNDNGNTENYKAVNYGPMDFVLINAIKEQQTLIKNQQETIAHQQTQIDELFRLLNEKK